MPPKVKTPRNAKYLAYIRTHSCCRCGYPPGQGNIHAHHVRLGAGAGMGMKPSDYNAVPLCAACHAKNHNTGERTFWNEMDIESPYVIIAGYMAGYFDDPRTATNLLQGYLEHERGKKRTIYADGTTEEAD